MPLAQERKLKSIALKKFGSSSSKRANAFVYGSMRRDGWKPSREMQLGKGKKK